MTLDDFVQSAIDRIQDIVHIDYPYDGPDQREEIKFVLLDLLTSGSKVTVSFRGVLPVSVPSKLNAQGILTAPTRLVPTPDFTGVDLSLDAKLQDLKEYEAAEQIATECLKGTFAALDLSAQGKLTSPVTVKLAVTGVAVNPGDLLQRDAAFEPIPGFRFQLLPDDCLDEAGNYMGPPEELP